MGQSWVFLKKLNKSNPAHGTKKIIKNSKAQPLEHNSVNDHLVECPDI